jgi:negative regulator of genetic competence, sporulation and motility
VVDRFKNKVKKMVKERSSKDSGSSTHNKKESVLKLFMPAPLIQNTLTLARKIKTEELAETNFMKYVGKFFTAVSFMETIYICNY